MSTMRVRMSVSVVGATVVAARGGLDCAIDPLVLVGRSDAPADIELSALNRAVASVGAEMPLPARIVRGVASGPYAARFASSSGRSTPPDMLTPAKRP